MLKSVSSERNQVLQSKLERNQNRGSSPNSPFSVSMTVKLLPSALIVTEGMGVNSLFSCVLSPSYKFFLTINKINYLLFVSVVISRLV